MWAKSWSRGVRSRIAEAESPQSVRAREGEPFSVLAAGVYTASWLDMTETQSFMPHFHEADPFVRPLLNLPKPLYYASGTLLATSVNWLGLKMERSPRWHKIWWLPQAISIAGNLGGFAYTRSNSIVTQTSSTRARTR
jgi:hypothetical protein